MIEVPRTDDLVLISKVEAILADAGIEVSFLPRRVLVASKAAPCARRVLMDAGLASELRDV